VTADERPLAVTSTHVHRLPGCLALVDAVTGTPTTSPAGRGLQGGQLLALDTDDRAGAESARPLVTAT